MARARAAFDADVSAMGPRFHAACGGRRRQPRPRRGTAVADKDCNDDLSPKRKPKRKPNPTLTLTLTYKP